MRMANIAATPPTAMLLTRNQNANLRSANHISATLQRTTPIETARCAARPAKSMTDMASTRTAIEIGMMPDVRFNCIGDQTRSNETYTAFCDLFSSASTEVNQKGGERPRDRQDRGGRLILVPGEKWFRLLSSGRAGRARSFPGKSDRF